MTVLCPKLLKQSIAADDGPMPQTVEAINYIRQVNIPFIVVLTKTDLPSANTEKALTELEKLGILFEGRGGSPHRNKRNKRRL